VRILEKQSARNAAAEGFMKQDMFVDVEQGFSEQNLNVLNKAVDAFAEFDPLVARVLSLSRQGQWSREFSLVTIAYYLLHRHKDEYHGKDADTRTPIPPVRITVTMEPETVAALQRLLKIMQAHPPVEYGTNGQRPLCVACREDPAVGHQSDCELQQAIAEAERLLKVA
jgi:hypothetical protein